jgi:segregation and condensation protein A
MSYNVKLDVFEGPLDLLLYFIKRDEINIYDIPISYITDEYLKYLNLMKSLNLHIAGEFILIASILMQIKAKMLLPSFDNSEDADEQVEDPRSELTRILVEYRKYKDASEFLEKLEENQTKLFKVNASVVSEETDMDIFLSDINLLELGIIVKKLLQDLPKPSYYEIETLKINITQQIQLIKSKFSNRKRIRFSEMASSLNNRVELVVTFLAILELVKLGELLISQKTIYGDIWISKSDKVGINAVAGT